MKIRKITLAALAPLTTVSTVSLVTGCNNNQSIQHTPMYYQTTDIASTVFTFDASGLNDNYKSALYSLQGILAQDKAQLFIFTGDDYRDNWFYDMKNTYKFNSVNLGKNFWNVLKVFKEYYGNKYIKYTRNDELKNTSINSATTIAGIKKNIILESALVTEYEALADDKKFGLTQEEDATNYTSLEVFNQYKDKLNNKMIINQKPNNPCLRDYAIASKSFCCYIDWDTHNQQEWKERLALIGNWAVDGAPLLGWNEAELNFVQEASQVGLTVLASDHCRNLSFYSAYKPNKAYVQKQQPKIKAQQGKHYLAIIMSDGDNAQWMQGDFRSPSWYGSNLRGKFPMTWTINPSTYDFNAQALDYIYSTQTTNDNLIAGPSGWAYVNPGDYKQDELSKWADVNNDYMKACGLSVINFLDNAHADLDDLKPLMQDNQVKGGVWSVDSWYIKDGGTVRWVNDKPVISMREGLWVVKPSATEEWHFLNNGPVADRINNYPTDIHSIDAYTCLICHAWSLGTMPNIYEFTKLLDDHVELVTAEQLIDLVRENVPHNEAQPKDYAYLHQGQ